VLPSRWSAHAVARSGVDRDKLPAETNISPQVISGDGYPQALRALNESVPGVTLMLPPATRFSRTVLSMGSSLAAASNHKASRSTWEACASPAIRDRPIGLIPNLAIDRMDLVLQSRLWSSMPRGRLIGADERFTTRGRIDLLGGSSQNTTSLPYGIPERRCRGLSAASGLHEGRLARLPANDFAILWRYRWRRDRASRSCSPLRH